MIRMVWISGMVNIGVNTNTEYMHIINKISYYKACTVVHNHVIIIDVSLFF